MHNKIVLLGGKGDSTPIVFNLLYEQFNLKLAIIEDKQNSFFLIKKRIKKFGYYTVFSQLFFQIVVVKFLKFISKNRIDEIIKINNLNTQSIPLNKLIEVNSVNSDKVINLLNEIKPDLIVVNGTRIISKKILSNISCKIINIHAGITPKYRGVHGAYWALVNNDKKNCGVTIHLVDEGIDTGSVIAQGIIFPKKYDNFVTYPFLQLAEGIKLLNQVIKDHFEKKIELKKINSESKLYSHPTIWNYLYYKIKRGIK